MKAINLNLTEILIKILLVIYAISLCVGIVAFGVWFFNGTAVNIENSKVLSRLPIKSALEFKHIVAFALPTLIESLIMIYILIKLTRIVKQFKNGFIFNRSISAQIKHIANWVIALVTIKIFLSFILKMFLIDQIEFELDSGFLIDLLLMALVYIIADMVDKGAQLKSENDLTI